MNAFESWKDACEQTLVNYPWINARSVSPLGFTTNDQIQSGVVFDVKRDIDLKDLAERIVQEVAPPIFNLHLSWMDSSHQTVETNIKLTLVNHLIGSVRYGSSNSMDDYLEELVIISPNEYKIANYRAFIAITFKVDSYIEDHPETIMIRGKTFYRLSGV